jgi:hypothetical protein
MKMEQMKKFNRVFVPNPNYKFDQDDLRTIANEIVYVCSTPMFDNFFAEEEMHRFEPKLAKAMHDFDPENDVIAYFGDAMIFGMMIMFVSDFCDNFFVGRFSSKEKRYIIRSFSYDNFTERQERETEQLPDSVLRPPLRPSRR